MLWTVTDIATDTLSTDILSQWLPSNASQHWRNVNKKHWQKLGESEFLQYCFGNFIFVLCCLQFSFKNNFNSDRFLSSSASLSVIEAVG